MGWGEDAAVGDLGWQRGGPEGTLEGAHWRLLHGIGGGGECHSCCPSPTWGAMEGKHITWTRNF